MSDQVIRVDPSEGPSDPPALKLPARWSIRIESATDELVNVKMAVGYDDALEMLEGNTPLTFDFVASNFTALIAAEDSHARIRASEWSDVLGEFQKTGGFGGTPRGKFTFRESGESSAGTCF